MVADSGTDVNIMDEHQFKAFVLRASDESTLEMSKIKLRTLQHRLDVKGEFEAVIRNETSRRIQSLPLISQENLTELGMLRIQPDGSFAETNDLGISREGHVYTVKQEDVQEMKDLITQYNHLFSSRHWKDRREEE